jgi:hypothetical protein
MKKVLVSLLLVAFFMMVSCDGEDTGNTGDTGNSGNTGDTGNTGNTGDSGNTGDTAETGACTDMSIIEPVAEYENYFALNVVAEINPFGASSEEITEAAYKKFNIKITGQPNTDLDPSMIYATLDEKGNNIQIIAMGDMGDNESEYNTSIAAMLPIDGLEKMKSDNVSKVDMAPYVILFKITELADNILKSCQTGLSDVSPEGSDFLGFGKMEVCLEENQSFESGELIRIGFNASMIVDPEEVADVYGVESIEELCTCYNVETGDEVECP